MDTTLVVELPAPMSAEEVAAELERRAAAPTIEVFDGVVLEPVFVGDDDDHAECERLAAAHEAKTGGYPIKAFAMSRESGEVTAVLMRHVDDLVAASSGAPIPRSQNRAARPREHRASRSRQTRAGPDEPRDDDPPLNGRFCVVDGTPLRGRQKSTCSTNCRKTKERRAKGVKPRQRRLARSADVPLGLTDAGLTPAYLSSLNRWIEIYRALPSANGSTPVLRAELAALTRQIIGEARRLEDAGHKRAVRAAASRAAYLAGVPVDSGDAGFPDVDGSWFPAGLMRRAA